VSGGHEEEFVSAWREMAARTLEESPGSYGNGRPAAFHAAVRSSMNL
jgi:hypothetical protein